MNDLNRILDTQEVKSGNEGDNLVKARKEAIKIHNEAANGGFEWLTEHSRNFLASGYLSHGVTAEGRIREIADRAEQILGIPGYSDKFFGYMAEGYFSLASPSGPILERKGVFP